MEKTLLVAGMQHSSPETIRAFFPVIEKLLAEGKLKKGDKVAFENGSWDPEFIEEISSLKEQPSSIINSSREEGAIADAVEKHLSRQIKALKENYPTILEKFILPWIEKRKQSAKTISTLYSFLKVKGLQPVPLDTHQNNVTTLKYWDERFKALDGWERLPKEEPDKSKIGEKAMAFSKRIKELDEFYHTFIRSPREKIWAKKINREQPKLCIAEQAHIGGLDEQLKKFKIKIKTVYLHRPKESLANPPYQELRKLYTTRKNARKSRQALKEMRKRLPF